MYDEIIHYGVGHLNGGHSGRYPWGSGKTTSGELTPRGVKKANRIARKYNKIVRNPNPSEKDTKKAVRLKNKHAAMIKDSQYDENQVNKDKKEEVIKNLMSSQGTSHVVPLQRSGYSPTRQNVSNMTDQELQSIVNRLRNEQAYKQFFPEKESMRKQVYKKIIEPSVTDASKKFLTNYLVNMANDLSKKAKQNSN